MPSGMDGYRVLRVLRRGELTEVLVAIAPSGRQVALKRPLPEHADNPALLRALTDEARIAARVDHPNVVGVLEAGLEARPPYLVLEYVDGADLFDVERRAAIAGHRFPVELALHIVAEVAHGLSAVHQAADEAGRPLNVVHRDVSPGNILVGTNGVVRLTDFGIAWARERVEKTAVGVAKGTLDYMAPEQLAGGPVDARADVFGLGCVLARLIFGKSPLDGLDPAARAAGLRNLSSEAEPDVAAIIERATRRKPADRYPDAAQLASAAFKASVSRLSTSGELALEAWLKTLDVEASTPSPRARLKGLFDPGALRRIAHVEEEEVEAKTEVVEREGQLWSDAEPSAPSLAEVAELSEASSDGSAPSGGFSPAMTDPDASQPRIRSLDDETTTFPPGVVPSEAHFPIVSERPSAPGRAGTPPSQDVTAKSALPRIYSSGSLDPETDGAASRPLFTGTLLEDRFLIGEELSVRRFGPTYAATDQSRDAPCLVTVLETLEPTVAQGVIARLKVFGRARAAGVASVLAAGTTPAGVSYVVTDRVDAPTAMELIDGRDGLEPRRAARIGAQLAEALSLLHAAGHLHLELSPSAVLVEPRRGEVVLALPGLGGDLAEIRRYAAPELGSQGPTTPRADLYALGTVLFYLLTGQAPFSGEAAEVEAQKREGRLAFPASVGGLGGVLRALLDPDPGSRPASAAEVARVLSAAASGGTAPRADEVATLPPASLPSSSGVDFAPRILASGVSGEATPPPPKLLLPYVLLALLGVVILVLTLWLVFARR